MADKPIETNKQSESPVHQNTMYNSDPTNLIKTKSDNNIFKIESEIQSSIPLSLDIGIPEMKQTNFNNNSNNNHNISENDKANFSSINNYNYNQNINNINNFPNTHHLNNSLNSNFVNNINGINPLGNLNLNNNFGNLHIGNSNNSVNKNSDFCNPHAINTMNSHFNLNANKDNEFYAMPSPFIKDGINLSSLYMNTLTSKQLEFSQHPPLIQNM